jgi:Polyketide synthase modules and related proteins
MLLQKAKFAKRIYATIVHSAVEICGDRMTPLISPMREPLIKLLEQFYETCGIDPTAVQFLEADGSGIKVSRVAEIDTSNLLESILLKSIFKNCFKYVTFVQDPKSFSQLTQSCLVEMSSGNRNQI